MKIAFSSSVSDFGSDPVTILAYFVTGRAMETMSFPGNPNLEMLGSDRETAN